MSDWFRSLTGWQQVAVVWAAALVLIVSFFFPMCTVRVSTSSPAPATTETP